ncbi:tyrosine--tRNA ligase, mitochondrial-like [Eurytemora carolleeae]|uniref:tyrosine--tRNA ligase, mitochondrial-like n=1 Tax=Eurytemora carolleeae TaxID=1294199 RepID=UPI000C760704|nr:tyrosine--tRNA ligase, mitochondrial-like [Eurytemora carolleeae]|eukprot:XP_023343931.1 tyrosine--tRNA ligase, mitochondrial-like [Eurytemora affinis]
MFRTVKSLQRLERVQNKRNFSRNILKVLADRDLIQDTFPNQKVSEFVRLLEKRSWGVYAGFDPTADSLHIGNLMVIMGLIHAQRSGHTPIALIGGATGQIGDPSGKSKERPSLDLSILSSNILGIKYDLVNIFNNHKEYLWRPEAGELKELEIVNNEDWYQNMNIIEFLGTIGRHFRVGTMLGKHSVKSRLNSDDGISLTEFTYQTFQAYDWMKLYKDSDSLIQIGGSDQLGNISAGQELISRALDKQVLGITVPLMVSESGNKFGKSSGTPVWLNSGKTSSFEVYQFMLRRPDSELEKLLKYFTFLPLGEIENTLRKHEKNPESRYGQEKLAENLTLLLHGEAGLTSAVRATNVIYNNDISELAKLSLSDTRDLFKQADYIQKLYTPGLSILDFALSIGCFKTERDALRIISAGGFYLNQSRSMNPDEILVHGIHILDNNLSMVRVGKKNYYIVEWT